MVRQQARQRSIQRNADTLRASLTEAAAQDATTWGARLPVSGEAAHYIVPSTNDVAQGAREVLTNSGVGVNSAYNGIGLNREVHSLTFSGRSGVAYNQAVSLAIESLADPVTRVANREQVIERLNEIATRLDQLQQYTGTDLVREWVNFMDWLDNLGGM